MSEKRFVVQEDANTEKIILLIDYKRMKMYSFLAEEREAVQKICDLLNEQQATISAFQEENEQLRQKLDFFVLDEFEWKEKYGDKDE